MPRRKKSLLVGNIYHVFHKSIDGIKIFNNSSEFSRMVETMRYYQSERPPVKFSLFMSNSKTSILQNSSQNLIDIIAYCLMPTHIHLILKQIRENGISIYIRNILNSYSQYFNQKNNRKGPLWQGRFKAVLVETDSQLLHLTRYIHLNPVTAYLVNKPEAWPYSSYNKYLSTKNTICNYNNLLDIDPIRYKEFVENRVSDQRKLAEIKKLILE